MHTTALKAHVWTSGQAYAFSLVYNGYALHSSGCIVKLTPGLSHLPFHISWLGDAEAIICCRHFAVLTFPTTPSPLKALPQSAGGTTMCLTTY